MFDQAAIASVKHLMDGAIRVSVQEEDGKLVQYVRVEKLNGTDFSSELVKL
jgi:KaiC/GvpD/RAD55 family RecA-like ATPase